MKRICLGAIFALVMSLPMCSYTQEPKHTPGATGQEQPKQPEVAPQAQSPPSQKEAKPPKATEPETSPSERKPADKKHATSSEKQPARAPAKSAHIPDAKFKANFGKQHAFPVKRVITNTTVIVPRQTQFVVAGYTFIFLDPWPEGW